MKMRTIEGRLTRSSPDTIDERTRRHIFNAIRKSSLGGTIQTDERLWEKGIVAVSSYQIVDNSLRSVTEFIQNLDKLLNSEGVAELKLEGEIMMSALQTEPVLTRITVKAGVLTYEKATVTWSEPLPV